MAFNSVNLVILLSDYVGDNPVKDFQAPQQLGMKSIWFRNADGIYQDTNKDSGWTARTTSELKDALLHGEK